MTADEWVASGDPAAMLAAVGPTNGDHPDRTVYGLARCGACPRQLRLFACAAVRTCWHLLTDPRSRRAVEVAERYADGLATEEERVIAQHHSHDAWGEEGNAAGLAYYTLQCPASVMVEHFTRIGLRDTSPPAVQAALLRDIVSPFRPVTLPKMRRCRKCGWDGAGPNRKYCERGSDPDGKYQHAWQEECPWRTPAVRALGEACYRERGGEACGRCGGNRGEYRIGSGMTGEHWHRCPDCRGPDGKPTGRVVTDGRLDPVRLALLADELEEAGATDAGLLNHLRGLEPCWHCHGSGRVAVQVMKDPREPHVELACDSCRDGWVRGDRPHVRGCFAIDAVLGLS